MNTSYINMSVRKDANLKTHRGEHLYTYILYMHTYTIAHIVYIYAQMHKSMYRISELAWHLLMLIMIYNPVNNDL